MNSPRTPAERLVVWSGIDSQRWEVAHFALDPISVEVKGTQIGTEPLTYRLDYAQVVVAEDSRYDQKLWNPEPEGERGVPSHLT
jgi:hypothetical protein